MTRLATLQVILLVVVLLSVACSGQTAATELPALGEGDEVATAVTETTVTTVLAGEPEVAATDVPEAEPEATTQPPATPEPTVTPAVSSSYSLHENLAELPAIPPLTLPEGASVYEDGSWFSSPHVEIAYHTSATMADIEAFYQALLPTQGWTPFGSDLRFEQGDFFLQIRMETGFRGVENEEVLYIGIRTTDPAMELPDLPLPEDAETVAYIQRFQFTTEANFDSLVAHYLDFYQTTLWPAAWQPHLNFAAPSYQEIAYEGRFSVRFERGRQNEIKVEEFDERDGSQPVGVDMHLVFEPAENGYRYAGGNCSNNRSFAFTTFVPVPANLDTFAEEKIGEYTTILQQVMAGNTLELVCGQSTQEGYSASYEFLTADNHHFRLTLHAREDTPLWRIALDGLDLNRPVEEQFLFWFEYNVPEDRLEVHDYIERRRRGVTVSEVAKNEWQETLMTLMEHVESLAGAQALGTVD